MAASSTNLCRLCVTTSDDFESLYDEEGQANDLHAMTCDYFHPKIVDMEKAKHLTVICLECFRHLQDFHNFQSSVTTAQLRLSAMEEGKTIYTIAEEVQTTNGTVLKPTMAIKVEREYESDLSAEYRIGEIPSPENYGTCLDNNSQTIPAEEFYNADKEGDINSVINAAKLEQMDEDTGSEFIVDYEVFKSSPRSENAVSESVDQLPKKKGETLEELIDKYIPVKSCTKCPQTFPCWRELKGHFRQQHPREEYQFTCCSRQFGRFTIKDHLCLHVDPDAFKCDLCGKRYNSKSSLAGHKADFHPESYMYSCSICAKRCSSVTGLSTHYREMHNSGRANCPKIEVSPNGRITYICQLCNQMVYTAATYRSHISKFHSTKAQEVCPICGKSYRNSRDYREHLAVHQHKKLYQCAYCSRTYTTLRGVNAHRQRHHPQESRDKSYINIGESSLEQSEAESNETNKSPQDQR